jgi:hypothetical protein
MASETLGHTENGDPAGHAEIHQAAGMLTVQLDVGVTEAYSRLNAHASASGQTPLAVARDVIAHRLTLPPTGPDDPPPADGH